MNQTEHLEMQGEGGGTEVLPLFLLAGAMLYAISPIDFVPDFLPVVGWFEDALALLASGVYALQKSYKLLLILAIPAGILMLLGIAAVSKYLFGG